MYKIKIINPYSDVIEMIIQRDLIPETGSYETVKSTPSIMGYPYVQVLEYRSYLLSIYIFYSKRDYWTKYFCF